MRGKKSSIAASRSTPNSPDSSLRRRKYRKEAQFSRRSTSCLLNEAFPNGEISLATFFSSNDRMRVLCPRNTRKTLKISFSYLSCFSWANLLLIRLGRYAEIWFDLVPAFGKFRFGVFIRDGRDDDAVFAVLPIYGRGDAEVCGQLQRIDHP